MNDQNRSRKQPNRDAWPDIANGKLCFAPPELEGVVRGEIRGKCVRFHILDKSSRLERPDRSGVRTFRFVERDGVRLVELDQVFDVAAHPEDHPIARVRVTEIDREALQYVPLARRTHLFMAPRWEDRDDQALETRFANWWDAHHPLPWQKYESTSLVWVILFELLVE